jgi:hypothetical protein
MVGVSAHLICGLAPHFFVLRNRLFKDFLVSLIVEVGGSTQQALECGSEN